METAELFPAPTMDEAKTLPGYRLHRLEVWNWGTFHQKVWSVTLDGNNALLTGDIGSGKSTLVDALTTLLLPSHRIAYNKAAGAENKERTLRTYVLGHYKSARDGEGGVARPVALRKAGENYSVVLAVFRNSGFAEVTTLAQVFWFKDQQGQPERFYVCADRELTISGDFSNIGSDLAPLRKRLRAMSGVEVHETFAGYAADFRRRFHVKGEQAWDLFHQTVSMKSVGNLTDFVREHMLQAPEVEERITDLLSHFEDLTAAHRSVAKAKDQVSRLQPLVAECDDYELQTIELRFLKGCRDSLKAYFSAQKCRLLDLRVQDLTSDRERFSGRRERRLTQRATELEEVRRLKEAVAEEGGDRLEQLDAMLGLQLIELAKRQQRRSDFAARLAPLHVDMPTTEAAFEVLQIQCKSLREDAQEAERIAQNRRSEMFADFRQLRDDHAKVTGELDSLRLRPSNLPDFQVKLRARLADALQVASDDLPFVGEMLQVRKSELHWEGAIERLLRSFALSLLVRDEHYPQVARWVSDTHLNGQLVYLRIIPSLRRASADVLPGNAAAHKLEVRAVPRFATGSTRSCVIATTTRV